MARPIVRVRRSNWRADGEVHSERAIPEETAVAFTFNTASYAVMMATPQDLEGFAVGFSLTEGVISSVDAIESVEVVEDDVGIELRIWLKAPHAAEFLGRRRKMARCYRGLWQSGAMASQTASKSCLRTSSVVTIGLSSAGALARVGRHSKSLGN